MRIKNNKEILKKEAKVRIYKSIVKTILTYTSETRAHRPITIGILQILETTEMNVLRKIVGKTRFDRIRNNDIRDECEIKPIANWIRKKFNDYISRITPERIVKIARDEKSNGRRSPVRPKRRWTNSYFV